MKKHLQLALTMLFVVGFQFSQAQLRMTEVRVRSNDTSTDTDYIEIQGTPGETIPTGTRIIAFSAGGGTRTGEITGRIQSIAGLTIPDDGYLSICRSGSIVTDIDLVDAGINWQSFQNLTFLIVEASSFIGSGTDLDADNDGVIDNVVWESVIDVFSLVAHDNATSDKDARAWDYSGDPAFAGAGTVITGANGSSTYHHAQLNPVTDKWEVIDSVGSYSDHIYDSPGNANTLVVYEDMTIEDSIGVFNIITKPGAKLTIAADVTITVINDITNEGNIALLPGASIAGDTIDYSGNDILNEKFMQEISITEIANKWTSETSSFTVEASTTSELALAYTVTGVATNDGNEITLTGSSGEVKIVVSQDGDDRYYEAKDSISFTVYSCEDISLTLEPTSNSCYGDTNAAIDLTVLGPPGYSISWSNEAETEDLSDLVAGKYIVTIDYGNDCLVKDSVTIADPDSLEVSGLAVGSTGADGTITLTVVGGTEPYSYSWSNSADSKDLSGLSAGIFSVTVTDANGCEAMGEFDVEEIEVIDSTSTLAVITSKMLVYPNPTVGELHMSLTENLVGGSYRLIDMTGRIVMKGAIDSTSMNLSMEAVNSGRYILFASKGQLQEEISIIRK